MEPHRPQKKKTELVAGATPAASSPEEDLTWKEVLETAQLFNHTPPPAILELLQLATIPASYLCKLGLGKVTKMVFVDPTGRGRPAGQGYTGRAMNTGMVRSVFS